MYLCDAKHYAGLNFQRIDVAKRVTCLKVSSRVGFSAPIGLLRSRYDAALLRRDTIRDRIKTIKAKGDLETRYQDLKDSIRHFRNRPTPKETQDTAEENHKNLQTK